MTKEKFLIVDTVRMLLEQYEDLRDSDEKLVTMIWKRQLVEFAFTQTARADLFFGLYEKGNITAADSITRCRRKLQEEIPALRGSSYNDRQHIHTAAAKDELKAIEKDMRHAEAMSETTPTLSTQGSLF